MRGGFGRGGCKGGSCEAGRGEGGFGRELGKRNLRTVCEVCFMHV